MTGQRSYLSDCTFVRHAEPQIRPTVDRSEWVLSAQGREQAIALGQLLGDAATTSSTVVAASAEAKAIETAELLGLGDVMSDDRLGEVAKPWYDNGDDHRAAAQRYLSGQHEAGWEPQASALARFDAALAALPEGPGVVVAHGTILALWFGEQITGFDRSAFWLDLTMPDAWHFEQAARTLTRLT